METQKSRIRDVSKTAVPSRNFFLSWVALNLKMFSSLRKYPPGGGVGLARYLYEIVPGGHYGEEKGHQDYSGD